MVPTMQQFEVVLTRPGAGSGLFREKVMAASPDEARKIAELRYMGYAAQGVKLAR